MLLLYFGVHWYGISRRSALCNPISAVGKTFKTLHCLIGLPRYTELATAMAEFHQELDSGMPDTRCLDERLQDPHDLGEEALCHRFHPHIGAQPHCCRPACELMMKDVPQTT